ncbi:ZZ-type zinc finger-containing protein 3-like [Hetaerina americana]|uniref:ZZ-type zinc finger-containing protein 3-like n=1 Tax=Hetaerina americana TaxID=62018 RepID=UPI003A7F1F66
MQTLNQNYHKHQRNNHLLYRPSTFFPSHDVPMSMSDSDEELSLPKRALISKDYQMNDNISRDPTMDQEGMTPPMKEKYSRDHIKLEMLKKVAREVEKTAACGNAKFQHIGYQCEFCKEEPIMGTRWHCDECMSSGDSIDYCSDCVVTLMDETENPFASVNPKLPNAPKNPHPLEHNLRPIRGLTGKTTAGVWDPDYLPDSFSGGYNYLDPNFMPE